jgi:hypothetical protein
VNNNPGTDTPFTASNSPTAGDTVLTEQVFPGDVNLNFGDGSDYFPALSGVYQQPYDDGLEDDELTMIYSSKDQKNFQLPPIFNLGGVDKNAKYSDSLMNVLPVMLTTSDTVAWQDEQGNLVDAKQKRPKGFSYLLVDVDDKNGVKTMRAKTVGGARIIVTSYMSDIVTPGFLPGAFAQVNSSSVASGQGDYEYKVLIPYQTFQSKVMTSNHWTLLGMNLSVSVIDGGKCVLRAAQVEYYDPLVNSVVGRFHQPIVEEFGRENSIYRNQIRAENINNKREQGKAPVNSSAYHNYSLLGYAQIMLLKSALVCDCDFEFTLANSINYVRQQYDSTTCGAHVVGMITDYVNANVQLWSEFSLDANAAIKASAELKEAQKKQALVIAGEANATLRAWLAAEFSQEDSNASVIDEIGQEFYQNGVKLSAVSGGQKSEELEKKKKLEESQLVEVKDVLFNSDDGQSFVEGIVNLMEQSNEQEDKDWRRGQLKANILHCFSSKIEDKAVTRAVSLLRDLLFKKRPSDEWRTDTDGVGYEEVMRILQETLRTQVDARIEAMRISVIDAVETLFASVEGVEFLKNISDVVDDVDISESDWRSGIRKRKIVALFEPNLEDKKKSGDVVTDFNEERRAKSFNEARSVLRRMVFREAGDNTDWNTDGVGYSDVIEYMHHQYIDYQEQLQKQSRQDVCLMFDKMLQDEAGLIVLQNIDNVLKQSVRSGGNAWLHGKIGMQFVLGCFAGKLHLDLAKELYAHLFVEVNAGNDSEIKWNTAGLGSAEIMQILRQYYMGYACRDAAAEIKDILANMFTDNDSVMTVRPIMNIVQEYSETWRDEPYRKKILTYFQAASGQATLNEANSLNASSQVGGSGLCHNFSRLQGYIFNADGSWRDDGIGSQIVMYSLLSEYQAYLRENLLQQMDDVVLLILNKAEQMHDYETLKLFNEILICADRSKDDSYQLSESVGPRLLIIVNNENHNIYQEQGKRLYDMILTKEEVSTDVEPTVKLRDCGNPFAVFVDFLRSNFPESPFVLDEVEASAIDGWVKLRIEEYPLIKLGDSAYRQQNIARVNELVKVCNSLGDPTHAGYDDNVLKAKVLVEDVVLFMQQCDAGSQLGDTISIFNYIGFKQVIKRLQHRSGWVNFKDFFPKEINEAVGNRSILLYKMVMSHINTRFNLILSACDIFAKLNTINLEEDELCLEYKEKISGVYDYYAEASAAKLEKKQEVLDGVKKDIGDLIKWWFVDGRNNFCARLLAHNTIKSKELINTIYHISRLPIFILLSKLFRVKELTASESATENVELKTLFSRLSSENKAKMVEVSSELGGKNSSIRADNIKGLLQYSNALSFFICSMSMSGSSENLQSLARVINALAAGVADNKRDRRDSHGGQSSYDKKKSKLSPDSSPSPSDFQFRFS